MPNTRRRIRLQTKFTFATLLLAVVLCVGLAAMSYRSFKSAIENRYRAQITGIVNTAAALVDPAAVRGYMEGAQAAAAAGQDAAALQDAGYRQLRRQFQDIARENGLDFLYSYLPDPGGLWVFVQSTTPEDGEFDYPLGYYAAVDVDYSREDVAFANLLVSDPGTEKIYISDTKYGYLITAFAVVPDETGQPYLVVGADLSMDQVNATLRQYLLVVCLIAVAIVSVFIGLYLSYLRRGMIRPLQLLVDSAVKFVQVGAEGQRGAITGMEVRVDTGDEIEDLANAFNQMSEDIVNYIHNLTAVTAEKERIGAELNVATTIQASMLPGRFPAFPGRGDFDIYATMTPAKEVGGDFYDFFLIDDDHLGLVMADVSGKGVPAALFMVRSMTLLKTQAMTGQSPGQVLTAVNGELCAHNEGELFVTVWLGILELSTGKLAYANAGHEYPLVRQGGRYRYVPQKPGFVLGGMEGMRYQEQAMRLSPGDALFQYTDGVTEATDAQERLYGADRLLQSINRGAQLPPDRLLPFLKEDIDAFVGDAPQFDDITMLALTYTGGKEP